MKVAPEQCSQKWDSIDFKAFIHGDLWLQPDRRLQSISDVIPSIGVLEIRGIQLSVKKDDTTS